MIELLSGPSSGPHTMPISSQFSGGEPKNCPTCGPAHLKTIGKIPASNIFAGRQLIEPLDGGRLYLCTKCHLAFRFPILPEQEMNALYIGGAEETWTSKPSNREDWRIARLWIRELLPQGSSILDVGCFDGAFLDTLDPTYQRFGVEIHQHACNKAKSRGVNIIASRHEDLPEISEKFDAVVSFDLIEHVPDPVKLLRALSNAVRPCGMVILSSGNFDAMTWRIMGSRYWYCAIAEHISFISPRWCDLVIPEVGLAIERQRRFSHARTGILGKFGDAAKNLMHYVAPCTTVWLREKGLGHRDVRHFPSLAEHPPSWMSARDHFIFLGRRTSPTPSPS